MIVLSLSTLSLEVDVRRLPPRIPSFFVDIAGRVGFSVTVEADEDVGELSTPGLFSGFMLVVRPLESDFR